jgi:phytoene desaturase
MPEQKAVVIGGGIGGLAIACLLAQKGYTVQVVEKNETLGGLCNTFEADGFRFDMGPSWYLMPDVFEAFFRLLGEDVNKHLDLIRLSPSYRIFFKDTDRTVDMYSDLTRDIPTFEAMEPGSGEQLREYLKRSASQYDIALKGFMYKNYDTVFDFLNRQTMIEGRKLEVFSQMHRYVEKFFSTDHVQKIMEYQLVFLGSSPYNTPALYNIMAHIDFNMGVFYPRGGIYRIVETLKALGEKRGVRYMTGAPVEEIETERGKATAVRLATGERITADLIISNASIHHTETRLLKASDRTYPEPYWDKRTLAPSAFILYLGVQGKIPGLVHHNLIFSKDWPRNFAEIFDHPQWPTDPSLYVCAPSVTDPTVAPPDHENLFVLVPTAPGLEADKTRLESYAQKTLAMLEQTMQIPDLRQRIRYQRIFWGKDFTERYNNFRGTALGLAHTLQQTAIFRPRNQSRRVRNLFYVGANTNPGIGMPICLISAELAYKRIVGDRSAGHLSQL